MALYTAGTAFLQVAPSMRGFHNEVRNQLRTMDLTAKVTLSPQVSKAQFEAAAKAARPSDQKVALKADVDQRSFADATNKIALLTRNIAQLAVLPAAGIAATPMVLGLAAAAVQASSSLLLLPAAGGAAGVVLGTLKVATAGFSAALKTAMDPNASPKKLAQDLAAIPAPARAVVLEIRSMRPEIDRLRDAVSGAFFANFAGEIDKLGTTYFPVLRTGMTQVATGTNELAVNTASYLRTAQATASVQTIFHNTADSMFELTGVGANVVRIFLDMAAVGSDFLPGLASGFASATDSVARFVAEARETGRLREWISAGLDTIGEFGKTAINLGIILGGVWNATDISGRAFAHTMTDVTARWAEWVQSAHGADVIHQVFQSLFGLAKALAPLFGAIAATIVGMLLNVGPQLPVLVTGLTDVLTAATPLTSLFGQLAVQILPPLAAALSFLAPVLGPLIAMMVIGASAQRAWAVATGIASAAQLGFNIAVTAGKVAMLAWQLIADAGTRQLVVWAAKQWLLNAAMTANPIGLVVVAIAAFVAAIVLAWNHSETFRAVVIGAWEAIKAAAVDVWGWLTDTIFPSFMRAVNDVGQFFLWLWHSAIVPAWEGIKVAAQVAWEVLKAVFDGIVFAAKLMFAIVATAVLTPLILLWNEVAGLFMWGYTNLIKPAWEGVTRAIQTAWSIISPIFNFIVEWLDTRLTAGTNHFRDVCREAWDNIRAAIQAAWQIILNFVWQPLVDFINTWMVPGFNILRDVAIAAWNRMQEGINAAWQIILNFVWRPLLDFINTWLVPGFNILRDGAIAAWNLMRDGINAGWQFILNNIWNPLVTFVTVTIPNGFQRGVDAVGRLWDGIKEKLRAPVKAAIDVVWNNGIVKAWNFVAKLVGLSPLEPVNIAGFATGGAITGGTPGKDSVLIKAMPGEYVLSKPAVDAVGGTNAVDQIHRQLRAAGPPAFATGGPVGGARVSGGASANAATGSVEAASPLALAVDWFKDLVGGISSLAGAVGTGSGEWGKGMIGMGEKLGNAALTFLKSKVEALVASLVGGGFGGSAATPNGAGGLGPAARAARDFVMRTWGLTNIGGYANRNIAGTNKLSDHATGHAIDIMIPNYRSAASIALGNSIAGWFVSNPGSFGTKYVIWRDQINSGSGWRPYSHPGGGSSDTLQHRDHVHVSVFDQGGSLLPGVSSVLNATGMPERVLSPRQTQAFEDLVGHLAGGRSRVMRADGVDTPAGRHAEQGGPFIGQVVVPVPEGASVDQTLDAIMTRARHEGKRSRRYGRP